MFQTLDFLKPFDIKTIWTECPAEVKTHIWSFMQELARTVMAYQKLQATTPEETAAKVAMIEQKMNLLSQGSKFFKRGFQGVEGSGEKK
jgi:hypothetical protein